MKKPMYMTFAAIWEGLTVEEHELVAKYLDCDLAVAALKPIYKLTNRAPPMSTCTCLECSLVRKIMRLKDLSEWGVQITGAQDA